jgi:hypothetical protein
VARDESAQRIDIGRLDDVVVEAGHAGALLVMLLAPSGQGDEQHPRPIGSAADLSRHVVSVHFRHADVENRHVGLERIECFERGLSGVDDRDVRAKTAELGAARVRLIAVVVDD